MIDGEQRGLPIYRLTAWLAVLGLGYLIVLRLDLPGHLSFDSVLSLREGRLHVHNTWNPAFFGWLLGVFDRIHRGTALYVAVVAGGMFASLAAMALLRPRLSWLAPPVAAALLATPQFVIYQGIVWKDVVFANVALAAFLCLAFTARRPIGRLRAAGLVLSVVLFAAAGLLRQNGLVLILPAAVAVAWSARAGGWRRAAVLAAGWMAAVLAMTLVLASVAQPQGIGPPDRSGAQGLSVLQRFDLSGAAARIPGFPLTHLERADPQLAAAFRRQAQALYTPDRVDTLSASPQLHRFYKTLPTAPLQADWRDLLLHHPLDYLGLRTAAFRWVVATPQIEKCLPIFVGVQAPDDALADLGIHPRQDQRDRDLFNYGMKFLHTPAMSHLAWGLVALLAGAALMVRRDPADIPMLAMLVGAFLFAASFFVLSIACDYRYLYFLDLAAMAATLYLALDPSLWRRPTPSAPGAPAPQASQRATNPRGSDV